MPLYEYQCEDCQSEFEQLVRNGQPPTCPHCQSKRVDKQWSVPAASRAKSSLPMADPSGMCGRPECGSGGCQGF